MKRWLKKLAARIDELSIRERGLVLIATVVVLVMFWDTLVMQPLYNEQQNIERAIAQRQASVNRLAAALQEATARGSINPNSMMNREREELRRRIDLLDAQINAQAANIIPPARMAELLQDILRRQRSLELVDIRSLPAESVFAGDTALDAALQGRAYRHGLVMEVRGSYLDLLAYLREIESLPYTFLWDELSIETVEYPRNLIRVKVYSLSLSEGLIGA